MDGIEDDGHGSSLLGPLAFGSGLGSLLCYVLGFGAGCCCSLFPLVLWPTGALLGVTAVSTGFLGRARPDGTPDPLAQAGLLLGALALLLQAVTVALTGGLALVAIALDQLS